jgi:hypothetical protein
VPVREPIVQPEQRPQAGVLLPQPRQLDGRILSLGPVSHGSILVHRSTGIGMIAAELDARPERS